MDVPPVSTDPSDPIVNERGVSAYAEPPLAERHRFSLGATFLGWSVAAFFTLVFVAVVAAIMGGAAYRTLSAGGFTTGRIDQLAVGTFVGYLLATFFAYVIGGYAAGRIALWDGLKHGLLTVAWAALFALVAVAAGASAISNVTILSTNMPVDLRAMTASGVVAIVATLLVMLGGAAVGGLWGERYHLRVHGVAPRSRWSTRTRGRPL